MSFRLNSGHVALPKTYLIKERAITSPNGIPCSWLSIVPGMNRRASGAPSPADLTEKFHRQGRKDRNESPTPRLRRDGGQVIRSEELPDRNLPDHISEFSCVSALNMGGFFAGFACFAVKLHCLGLGQLKRASGNTNASVQSSADVTEAQDPSA